MDALTAQKHLTPDLVMLRAQVQDSATAAAHRFVEREAQKAVAKEVLDDIRKLDDTAVVAGGAPRDWFWGGLAKDIDIFYYLPYSTDHGMSLVQHITTLTTLFGDDLPIKILGIDTASLNQSMQNVKAVSPVEDVNNYMLNPDILHVFEFEYKEQTIQLIALANKGVNVEQFAFNLCQVWWDGETTHSTDLFKVGMAKKLLIETGHVYANGESYKRKMKEKFPDYTYIASRIVYKDACNCPFKVTGVPDSTPAFLL